MLHRCLSTAHRVIHNNHSQRASFVSLPFHITQTVRLKLRLLEMSVKDIIAVDIDEVLAHFVPTLTDFYNEIYSDGSATLTVDSFISYDFHKVWGGTPAEAIDKMDRFFDSAFFKEKIPPITHALHILNELKNDYDLHIVTARQHKLEDITRNWIERYFPNVFHEIHFGNHYSACGKSRSKPEMCKAINAKLLIDDSLNYATQCVKEGIQVVLFGNYPWNQVPGTVYEPNMTPEKLKRVQFVNDIKITDYQGESVGSNTAAEKIVYRVTTWDDVRKLIYQMLPVPGKSLDSASSATKPSSELASSSSTSNSSNLLNIFAVQMCSVNDKQANLKRIEKIILDISVKHQLKSENEIKNLICLPECCLFMGNSSDETVNQVESIDLVNPSSSLQFLCKLAKEHSVWLSIGGFPERSTHQEGKMFNSHFLINADGLIEPSSIYRKLHLFDCPLVGLQESRLTDAGNEIKSFTLNGWNIGLTICYDLRFPALYQKLRNEHDIDVVLVPSAFTVPTGKAHWETLLKARAIENQIYVVAPAQAGVHNLKRESFGHSMVIDPWGTVLSQLTEEKEGYCHAVLSKSKIQETRLKMPIESHLRKDVY